MFICFRYDPKDLTVVAGTNSLSQGGDIYKVVETIPHEQYVSGRAGNDISLIKVDRDFNLNKKVAIIPLQRDDVGIEAVTLCGWGRTSYPGNIPDKLQQVVLNTISVQECIEKAGNTNEQEICTLAPTGTGACHGDSGGPLILEGRVCGIVSRGYPCALGRPDMFTRVSAYADWIDNKIRE